MVVEQALAAGFGDQVGELVGGDTPYSSSSRGCTPHEPQHAGWPSMLNSAMTGPHDGGERQERRHQPDRGALRPGDGDVLGHHLAEHDVRDDHDDQRRPRTRSGASARRDAEPAERPLDEVGHRGLAERPSSSEQIVMPSWAAASITGEVGRRPAARSGHPRCPRRAIASSRSRRAEISENSAPTKNALASEQANSREQGEQASRSRAASCRRAAAAGTVVGGQRAARRCGGGRGASRVSCQSVDVDVVADVGDAPQLGRAPARPASRSLALRASAKPVASATSSARSSPETIQLSGAQRRAPGPPRRGRARRGRRRRSPRRGPRA